ncbi:CLUMA_CG005422, isoform A [Clunio marinus]|uniref:CLUMA_CG005422, isoform A n=1 Tax=Clunio marinus TaxID=568069 RepID=A0A1J1HUP4_9DIPT|nr:CLUMA_CG005422, isoform A [Clunio marinus]
MPIRHKTENVFKFKKFSERVNEVDLRSSALYRIEHKNEIPDENQSYFYQTHQKWILLNLTEEFALFDKQLKGVITTTLPQLLHHKEKVIGVLLERLDNATTLSLQPLLELTVALSRDLRKEFYSSFQQFFERLVKLLQTHDADQTEWTLVCLAFLFKTLKPFLVKDISIIVKQIIPLLSEKDQPEHIINFTVECFAFLVKNLENKDNFIVIILKNAKQDESSVLGCGKLFFEMIKGFNGQFHSKGEEFLEILFNAYRKSEYKKYWEVLNEILVQTIGSILDFIDLKNISKYWNILQNAIKNILQESNLSEEEKATSIQHMLHFLGQSIEFQGGKKVVELPKIINLVIQIIDHNFPIDVMMTLSKVGAVLLLSKNFVMGQLEASRLSKKILHIDHNEVFESFVVNAIGYSQFDILIMPDFLKYFERNLNKTTLEILAKIVSQRTSKRLLETEEEENLQNYNLNMRNQKTLDDILSRITNVKDFDKINEDELEQFLLSLQIIPHLMSFDKEKTENVLKNLLEETSRMLSVDCNIKWIYLLAVVISGLHRIESSTNDSQTIKIIELILPMTDKKKEFNFPCLRILHYLVKSLNKSKRHLTLFKKLHEMLTECFMSPFHDIRLVSFQILSCFEHLKLAQLNESNESIFMTFKRIEEITPTIQTYRDQILLLQKLEYGSIYFKDVKDSPFVDDAIKFCLGFTNQRLQLLWEPTKNVLESYINGYNLDAFWKIFKEQLVMSSTINHHESESEMEEIFTQNDFINEQFLNFSIMEEKSRDLIAYRVKLWQFLSDTKSNVCDVKQRDIVDLFMNFFHNEYQRTEEDKDEDEENKSPKARQKLLIIHLQVLSKFNNPKCVIRTNELRNLYIDLLLHRNFQVQRLSLDCIIQYKDESLTTYKDVLYNILDEKQFRQELVGLKLNEKIREDHRETFMTIKAGKKDQEGFKNKKEIITRFMSNLKESELTKLVEIACGKISSLINLSDAESMINAMKRTSNIIKVNELQSILQFLDLIKKNVAGLFSVDFQRKILDNILAISCYTITNDTTMFKNLKQSCLVSLVEYFEHFDEFTWNVDEIEVLFKIFVWNYLKDFHLHSSQNVSGLMKLFIAWSKNPKYFNLLAKSDDNGNYALKSIMKLLTNKSTTNVVIESVLDILERLLTLKLDEEVIENFNYGTKLVEPFIQDVLKILKETLSNKKMRSLNQRNLVILSRTTELVTDVDSSKILLDILFPLTLKKAAESHQDGQRIMKLMMTISNLLNVIPEPHLYMRQLSPLFEQIIEVNHRKSLIKIFNQIVPSTDANDFKSMINDFNAYDRRWIEQPDYEKRLSVFHRLEKIISSGSLSLDVAIVVIYHCFYFLKHDKDLAMRDNAGHFLKLVCLKMIQQCGDNKQQLDIFVDKIVLNLIQKRLRDDEKVRTESIILLGELAREQPNAHSILADLHPLTNAANRELDFFDNITHLQKFRHMKALRKFVEVAESYQHVPNLRTLNEFLLPIGKMFLCQEEYKRKSKVVEAAIEFIATVAKFLPWNSYEMLLKFYVRKVKNESGYQKQLVKLIPAILDSFHFDLNCNVDKVSDVEVQDEENDEEEEEDEDNEDEEEEMEVEVQPIHQLTVLRENIAQRVIKSLTRRLVPSLFKIIAEISTDAHKLNKETRRAKEKADMLKIPIALPIIKLLKKLPSKFLNDYLSQVVLKVSSFLKSNLKQVRATARFTLKEILMVLGPNYMELMIGNLKAMLSKGFQVHVLSATVHTLMEAMKSQLEECDVADKLVDSVLSVCVDDIFGKVSEEHEVGRIGHRTPEAKASRKSFLTLSILAATVNENRVFDLLMPFKTQLHETQSKRTVGKIQECLQKIVTGLTSNKKIPDDSLLILVHGTISESISDLLPEVNKKKGSKQQIVKDSFIIPEEPKRRGATIVNKLVKTTKQTNSHILVEFGLEMLHLLLKRKKFPNESFLDPLIPMVYDALKSNFLRANTLAVKCISIMLHYQLNLPKLKENTTEIVNEIFSILHKYATNQISKKDNHFLLVKSAFKCVVVVLRQVDYYVINENQLKALLLYVEQDLNSFSDKDTMAFTLLKSILDKKLMVPEVHEIMKKVAHLSITSESEEKRAAIRPIVLTYLMEYPIGKKIDSLIKFFIGQLNYEEISGRESAILTMGMIFKNFPLSLLRKFSGLFFLSLGTRLVNDESPQCREKIAEIIELLIKQLDNNPRQQLFEIVILLLKDKKIVHREMAAQLCIRFVNVEGEEFVKRTLTILPLLVDSLTHQSDSYDDENVPGKFVRMKTLQNNDDGDVADMRDQQTVEDHHLIQTLNAIIRIFENQQEILSESADDLKSSVNDIGYQAKQLLSHDHVWVRLRALRIINFMIKSINVKDIEKVLRDEEVDDEKSRKFLHSKVEFRSVVFDMVVQLKPDVDEELLRLIIENLIEVSKIIKTIPFEGMINDKKDFNIMWLVRRLRYAINNEIVNSPSSFMLRKSIFEYFNNLVDNVDVSLIHKLASSILPTLFREMTEGEHTIEDLKLLAAQVSNRIKSKIGFEKYESVRNVLRSKMLRNKVDRRKSLAQEKINNPAKAATRTIVKQLKKQDRKKRKRQDIQDGIILPRKKRRVFGSGLSDTYE